MSIMGLALCLTKVRSSRARCPATALIHVLPVYSKDWKPGFQECSLVRRHTYIPQSMSRCVHVLSNESVFKGESFYHIKLQNLRIINIGPYGRLVFCEDSRNVA